MSSFFYLFSSLVVVFCPPLFSSFFRLAISFCYYCSLSTRSVLNPPILPRFSFCSFLFLFFSLLSPNLAHGVNSGPVSFVKTRFPVVCLFHTLSPSHVQYPIVAGSGRQVDHDGLCSCCWATRKKKSDELRTRLYQPVQDHSPNQSQIICFTVDVDKVWRV